MLETVIAKFITKYLNEYIETLNKSQMEMELWKGHAVFQNLTLLPTALSKHHLPFRVRKGTIAKISLNLPWKKLTSEACVVEVSDIFIIVELDPEILIKSAIQAEQSAFHVKEETVTKEEEKGTWQSLINTVIDNARVNIKNIHIRIEMPQQFGIYALGLIVSSLTFNTCNENKVPLMQMVPNNIQKLYKILVLNNFSVYFDTICAEPVDLNSFEIKMKEIMTSKDHQFIFHPLTLECLLLHTRNIPGKLKNELTISTQQFKISIDYSQCRAILEFNQKLAMLNRRRKYAACARPKNLETIANTINGQQRFWRYMFRCAKMKNRPNEFHPQLALAILKNREQYVKLYRKKEKQKKVPHPILKKKLKSLDETIGTQAALFLRQYASAIVQKETQVQNSGITAFDLSELKGILQTGDRFFEMDSFSLEMIIPAFQVELLYSPGNVLASIIFANLTTNVKSVQTHAEIHFGIIDLTCVSFIKGNLRSLISVDRNQSSDFMKLITVIPRTADPFSMSIVVEPVTTTFDTETVKCVMEFFVTNEDNRPKKVKRTTVKSASVGALNKIPSSDSISQLDEYETHATMINRVDAADKLQSLQYFKNHSLNVHFKGLTYIYPFKFKDQNTEVKFAIRDLSVEKTAIGILPADAPEIKMNFHVKFTIDDLLIAGHCLLSKFVFDLPFNFTYYYGTDAVSIACNFSLSKLSLLVNDEALKSISAALNYGKTIQLNTGGSQIQETPELQEKTVFSYGKVRTDLNFVLEEVKITLNEIEIGIAGITANYHMLKGSTAGLFKIDTIGFIVNNQNLLDLPKNSTEIILTQKSESEKMNLTFLVRNLHILLDLKKYKKIYSSLMALSSDFMKETDIQIGYKPDEDETEEEREFRLERERLQKLQKQQEQESSMEFNVQMDGTSFEIPDILGNYFISFEKILFKNAIELQNFNLVREGRNVVSPTTLSVKMEDEIEVKIDGLHSQIDPSDIWAILRLIDDVKNLFANENEIEIAEQNAIKKSEEKPTEYSTYKVLINNANLELYDRFRPALIVNSNMFSIIAKMNNIDLNVDINLENFIGYQIINNKAYNFAYFPRAKENQNENEFETVSIKYYSKDNNDQLDVILPKGKIYLTNEVYRYIFKFIPPNDVNNNEVEEQQNKQPAPIVNRKSKYGAKMIDENCELELVLINKIEETMRLLTKNFYAYASFVNDDSLDLEITSDSIIGFLNFKDPDFQFLNFPSHFYFRYYHDCITLKSESVIGRFCNPIVTALQESIIALISEPIEIQDFSQMIEIEDDKPEEPFKIGFGLVVDIGKIEIEIFPSDFNGQHCFSTINKLEFALKTDQKLSALSIKNIIIDVQNANPDRALEIEDIRAVLCFNDLSKDISNLKMEEILALEDKRDPTPFSFDMLNGNWSVKSVSIKYTHRFAHAVIHNFMNQNKPENVKITMLIPIDYEIHEIEHKEPEKATIQQEEAKQIEQKEEENKEPEVEKQTQEENKENETNKTDNSNNQLVVHFKEVKPPEKNAGSSDKMIIKADLNIDAFKLGLFLIDPLATIEFLDVNAKLTEDIWSANVRQFNLYQGSDDKTSLIKSPLDSDLVKFSWVKNTVDIVIAEMTANIDYLFYLTVVNFVLRSPFLHIPYTSKSTATTSSSTSSENIKALDVQLSADKSSHPSAMNSDNISLPFNLNFKAPKFKITVPTSIEKKDYPLFHIEMNILFHLTSKIMEARIYDFTLYFSDEITKIDYVPILEKVKIRFIRKIEKDGTISLAFAVSNITIKLSAIDFVLFGTMAESINKSTAVMMFSEDTSEFNDVSEEEDKQYSLASSFSSLKFNSENIELIICRDNRSSAKHIPLFQMIIPPIKYELSTTEQIGSMNFKFEPYIQYYNETTGFWDMILEPFPIQTMGILSNEKFRISFRCENEMNINLPAKAVLQYMNLADEIKSNMMKIGEKFIELPNFWIENTLGSDAQFKIGQYDKSDFFIIGNTQRIPIYNINISTEIFILFNKKCVHFCPKFLTYPLMLTDKIMVIRKPFQGGICLVLKSCMELYNKLSTPIDIFTRQNKTDKFNIIQTIETKQRLPLYLSSKPVEYLITEHDSETKVKHHILNLSRYMSGTQSFLMGLKNKSIKVCLSVKNEVKTGTRLLTLFSPIKAVSHLPIQIQMKWENEKEPIILESEETIDFFVNEGKNKFKASFSVDGKTYGPLTKLNMKSKDPQKIVAAGYSDKDSNEGETQQISFAVIFDFDEDSEQITASFYTPVGIFNYSTYIMTIFEKDEKVEAKADNFSLWCPKAFFSGKNEIPMNLKFIKNKDDAEYSIVNNFDCVTPRTTNLFTPIMNTKNKNNNNLDKAGISYAFRYDISIQSQASIITISPLLQVYNSLDVDIKLQPLNNSTQRICGEKYLIKKKSEMMISKMTPDGTFMLSIASFSTNPILSLTAEQKIVFKIQSQENSMLIEVETVDVGTNLECHFRPVVFPTPIVICNSLPTKVTAFHLYNVQPFIIEPFSTSVFAFDEPLSYPSAHFFIGDNDDIHLSLCLVEDTDYIRTDALYEDKPIYVSISKVINGSRALSITTKIPQIENRFTSVYSLTLSQLNISLIDFQTREFALISLDNFNTELQVNSNNKLIRLTIDSFQIDDQDPLTPTPVVLYGRKGSKMPFLSFNCIVPSDTPFFTNVTYCSVIFQRVDVEIDSTFISDVYYILLQLTKDIKSSIKPQQKIEKSDSSSVVTFNWLEMSPINILLHYNRKSGRKTRIHKLLSYLKYIPSLSNGKLLLPGVITANVSDTLSAIQEKIMNEYKTQAFNQLIQMLGSGGKLMTAFGVTKLIAEVLGVKIESELSNDIHKFSSSEMQMEFDNRRKVNGAFSQESLDALSSVILHNRIRPSNIINDIKKQQIANIGLKTKSVSNIGGGQGVLGVLTKVTDDSLTNVARMDKAIRKRVPRAYPNNTISKFDEKISRAQNLIQAASQEERSEVIRIAAKSANEQFVCITDNFVYAINEDFQKISSKFKIANLSGFKVSDSVVSFATSKVNAAIKASSSSQQVPQNQQQQNQIKQQSSQQQIPQKQQQNQIKQQMSLQQIPQNQQQQNQVKQQSSQQQIPQNPQQQIPQNQQQQNQIKQQSSQQQIPQKQQQNQQQQNQIKQQSSQQQIPSKQQQNQQQQGQQQNQIKQQSSQQQIPQKQQQASQKQPQNQQQQNNTYQIIANDNKEALSIMAFLQSQKIAHDLFGFSLLQ